MSTLTDNIENLRSKDPLDQMIFERGLRIRRVWIDRETDLIIVLLNNKKILKRPFSDFVRLANATEEQLLNFQNNGIDIHWPQIDEDLSLRGFLKYELEQVVVADLKAI